MKQKWGKARTDIWNVQNISLGDGCISKDPNVFVRGYKAELTGKKAHQMSILEPREEYTSVPVTD